MNPTWQSSCGRVSLWLGDCLEILPTIPAGTVDAVVTDPPYGIRFAMGSGGGGGSFLRRNGDNYEKRFTGKNLVIGDHAPFDPSHLLAVAPRLILWGGNHYASRLPDASCWLIWDKRRGTTTNDFADCEIAWTNLKKPSRIYQHLWNGMLRDSERGIERVHPTQKPISVMIWSLQHLPLEALWIVDPYMGSGSIGIAAVRLGLRFMGIEIDPHYFAIAKDRIEAELAQPSLFDEPRPDVGEQTVMEL